MSQVLLFVAGGLVFLSALMFFVQRSLIYFPQPGMNGSGEQVRFFQAGSTTLSAVVLNQGRQDAIIYFGGNAERTENNASQFRRLFPNHTIYLMHYRGYGLSEGQPNESDLCSDAVTVYDAVTASHSTLSVIGRSLGSGVASYLSAHRPTEKLVLITPFDSLVAVASRHYPFLPVSLLLQERYESFKRASAIGAQTLVIAGEMDTIVPPQHARRLATFFSPQRLTTLEVAGADHNTILGFPEIENALVSFFAVP